MYIPTEFNIDSQNSRNRKKKPRGKPIYIKIPAGSPFSTWRNNFFKLSLFKDVEYNKLSFNLPCC